jgi:SAM-dependent methyltransferase
MNHHSSSSEIEYTGLLAQSWDVFRGDTSNWPDRSFYLEIIDKNGPPVLDIGCGTGRLLLDYLQLGIDIDGVDNSPEMLDLCRQKAAALGLHPNLYQEDMVGLELPRHYGVILIPSSSLQLIIEPFFVAQALNRVFTHLIPGGLLAASIMTLWRPGEPLENEGERSVIRVTDGATFRRVSKTSFDPEIECESTEDFYQLIVDGEVVTEELHQRSPATRSYTQSQIRLLFKSAGFHDVQLFSEFTFDPVKPADTLFVVVGSKPD